MAQNKWGGDQDIKSKPIKTFPHFAQMSKFFRLLCGSFLDLTHANVSLKCYVLAKNIVYDISDFCFEGYNSNRSHWAS